MPDVEIKEIKWGDLQTQMKGYVQEEFAKLQKKADPVTAKQEAKVEASVDGKPVAADLVKAGTETKANMGAVGIAGLVESGDHFKIMRFELGPITSALVGIPVGVVASKAIDAWVKPYKDAAGVPTAVRPPSIGFGQINLINPALHVGGMVLAETYGHQFLGRTAAHFIAGTLLVSTLLTYTPLGAWLDNLVLKISPKVAVVQDRGMSQAQLNALRQQHAQEQRGAQNGHRMSWL